MRYNPASFDTTIFVFFWMQSSLFRKFHAGLTCRKPPQSFISKCPYSDDINSILTISAVFRGARFEFLSLKSSYFTVLCSLLLILTQPKIYCSHTCTLTNQFDRQRAAILHSRLEPLSLLCQSEHCSQFSHKAIEYT